MERIKFGKCPYADVCNKYKKDNIICNEEGGFYGARFAGCYREMGEKYKSKFRLLDLIKNLRCKK